MDTIKIVDKEYPIVFGRGALRLFARHKGITDVGNKEFLQVLGEGSIDDGDYLHYAAHKAGCSAEGVEFPYSFDEFQQVLTDHPHLVDEFEKLSEEQTPSQSGKKKGGKG